MLPVLVSLLEECRPEWRDEMIDELAQVLDRQSEITFNISRVMTERLEPTPTREVVAELASENRPTAACDHRSHWSPRSQSSEVDLPIVGRLKKLLAFQQLTPPFAMRVPAQCRDLLQLAGNR